MRPDQTTSWVSDARFRSYLDACQQNHAQAVALYEWNVEVSGAFFEVLHHIEVLLRNATDRQFPPTQRAATAEFRSGRSWMIPWRRQRRIESEFWLTDRSVLSAESVERVLDVAALLARKRQPLTRDRLIAALSFGFWRALYDRHYAGLWDNTLRGAFPNGNGKRKQVADLLARVHPFRNRIAHHEAIFEAELRGQHDRLLHLAGLIDADARKYIAGQSRVPALLATRPRPAHGAKPRPRHGRA